MSASEKAYGDRFEQIASVGWQRPVLKHWKPACSRMILENREPFGPPPPLARRARGMEVRRQHYGSLRGELPRVRRLASSAPPVGYAFRWHQLGRVRAGRGVPARTRAWQTTQRATERATASACLLSWSVHAPTPTKAQHGPTSNRLEFLKGNTKPTNSIRGRRGPLKALS